MKNTTHISPPNPQISSAEKQVFEQAYQLFKDHDSDICSQASTIIHYIYRMIEKQRFQELYLHIFLFGN